jgi:hypothetical protein
LLPEWWPYPRETVVTKSPIVLVQHCFPIASDGPISSLYTPVAVCFLDDDMTQLLFLLQAQGIIALYVEQ